MPPWRKPASTARAAASRGAKPRDGPEYWRARNRPSSPAARPAEIRKRLDLCDRLQGMTKFVLDRATGRALHLAWPRDVLAIQTWQRINRVGYVAVHYRSAGGPVVATCWEQNGHEEMVAFVRERADAVTRSARCRHRFGSGSPPLPGTARDRLDASPRQAGPKRARPSLWCQRSCALGRRGLSLCTQ